MKLSKKIGFVATFGLAAVIAGNALAEGTSIAVLSPQDLDAEGKHLYITDGLLNNIAYQNYGTPSFRAMVSKRVSYGLDPEIFSRTVFSGEEGSDESRKTEVANYYPRAKLIGTPAIEAGGFVFIEDK
ncbi:hypothetical protein GTHT12_03776 (plasmid) [Geobacillus thermodenitrificans]|uniref:hypothetical protein n=1 Tax=Geobacillus thermodenitrificans TaxID=33940 RepID=UPI000A294F74|nr:hypothetical protein [Geobacillus thermodenitrificans]ARP44642.1 hypothetical protein GTHT12_03776 [Geobacillus thermodenitrificans]